MNFENNITQQYELLSSWVELELKKNIITKHISIRLFILWFNINTSYLEYLETGKNSYDYWKKVINNSDYINSYNDLFTFEIFQRELCKLNTYFEGKLYVESLNEIIKPEKSIMTLYEKFSIVFNECCSWFGFKYSDIMKGNSFIRSNYMLYKTIKKIKEINNE